MPGADCGPVVLDAGRVGGRPKVEGREFHIVVEGAVTRSQFLVHVCSVLVMVIDVYRIGEFAKRVGQSAGTVRRWEREGRIQVHRGPAGQRYFDESDIRKVL
jgi:hypothetical protein